MVSWKKHCARWISALLVVTMCMHFYVMPVLAEEEITALNVEAVPNDPQGDENLPAGDVTVPETPVQETEEEEEIIEEKEEEAFEESEESMPETQALTEPTGEPVLMAVNEGEKLTGHLDKTECSSQPEVTVNVSPEHTEDEKTAEPSASDLLDEKAVGALLADLAGWELLDENGNTLGIVQADGTVKNGDQKILLAFRPDGNGSYTLELLTEIKAGEMITTEETKTTETKDGVTTTTETSKKEQEYEQRKKKITVTVVEGRTVVGYWRGGSEASWNDLNMAEPDESLLSKNDGSQDETLNEKHLCNDAPAEATDTEPAGEFRYVGYGVASTVLVRRFEDQVAGNVRVHQFKLLDKENRAYYVYCADMAQTAIPGYYYDMTNVEDAAYYQGENGEKHIQAVCANGYWGTKNEVSGGENEETENAMGSLAYVQALLREYRQKLQTLSGKAALTDEEKKTLETLASVINLTDEQINALDDGFALAATQAAIWKFGNHNGDKDVSENPLRVYGKTSANDPQQVIGNETDEAVRKRTLMQQAAANAFYELLISDYLMEQSQPTATDLIRLEDITGAAITVKDKVDTEKLDAAVKDALGENENDVYTTDLSFAMAVIPDAGKDSILVRIYCGGKVIATRRLAGENAEGETYDMILPDAEGNYRIENIQLPEGMKISLKLEGTQHLDPGVYLYKSDDSQNFIGLSTSESTRNLELEVTVEFKVKNAVQETKIEERSWKETRTEAVTTITQISEPQLRETVICAKSVQTGDGAVLWQLPLMAGAAGMCILLERKRKKSLQSEKNML